MISVAMASFNGGKYIREQIDSILSQTVDDIELVICDDCSKDDTWNILQGYSEKDKRVRVYRNDKNLGLKKNFEKAMYLCKGEYIALSDQDDIWLPQHLDVLKNVIGEKTLACGNSRLMDGNGEILKYTMKEFSGLYYVPDNDLKKAYSIILFRSSYQGANMLFKSTFRDKALPIPDNLILHDSWLAALSCFCGGINYTEEVISYYRRHGHNVTEVKKPIMIFRKIRPLIAQAVKPFKETDRIPMVDDLIEKLTDISEEEKAFLQDAKVFYQRRKSIGGRLLNMIYEIKHYRDIFSCGGIHWI